METQPPKKQIDYFDIALSTVIIIVFAVAGYIWFQYDQNQKFEAYIEEGKEYFYEGEYAAAVGSLSKALSIKEDTLVMGLYKKANHFNQYSESYYRGQKNLQEGLFLEAILAECIQKVVSPAET